MKLLQVRDRNEDMAKDWLIFISRLKANITAGEIYLAHEMAITREIFTEEGKEFDLLPQLSNNTTAKVISAYLRFKKSNLEYDRAKEKLKALKSTENEPSEKEKQKMKEELIKMIFQEVSKTGLSKSAWLIYENLHGKIKISKEDAKRMYSYQLKIYESEVKKEATQKRGFQTKIIIKELKKTIEGGKKIQVVQNRCRSILVSDWIKKNCENAESLKEILE